MSNVVRFFDFFEIIPLDHVPFSQGPICQDLKKGENEKLFQVNNKYGGLCEIICNLVLSNKLLNKGNNPKRLLKKITIASLSDPKIQNSHTLEVYSLFRKALAFLFGIYPDNLFSIFEQRKLVGKNRLDTVVNRELLEKRFKQVEEGETLKLHIFHRTKSRFTGHSLLIQKQANDKYTFFDPNVGEKRRLTFADLCALIDEQLLHQSGTDIFLSKGETFLNKLNTI